MRVTLRPSRLIIRSGPSGPAGPAGTAGAGGVTSVNGDVGPAVTLDAADVGADAAGTAAGLIAALAPGDIGAVPTGQWSATGITGAGTTVTESLSFASWQAGGAPRPFVGADVRHVPIWDTSGTPKWVSRALTGADVGGVVLASEVSDTPGAGLVSRADGAGKLDGWISDATDIVKGLVLLGATGGAQAYSAILTAITALTALSTGLIVKTGSGTVAVRSVTGSNGVSVTNGDGVAANIAVAGVTATTSAVGVVELATDLEATSSVVPTGADTRLGWAFRSLHLAVGY